MVQVLFPNNDAVFQDNSTPIHIGRSVHCSFVEHEDALQHLLWLAQSPNLRIVEPVWSVWESRVRSRFPPSSLKQLEEEWYKYPLETIQILHESIPRRIQALLQANCYNFWTWSYVCLYLFASYYSGTFHIFCSVFYDIPFYSLFGHDFLHVYEIIS